MANFIFDELTGVPTVSATHRAKRVDQTGAISSLAGAVTAATSDPSSTSMTSAEVDRFAKGNEHLTPPATYQDADDWMVRVFKNKYPIVEDHEIIVHSPDPTKDIPELSHEQNVRIIRAYLNRLSYYTSSEQEKEVMIFNNKGRRAGASITHPHSQVIALKGFPGIIEMEKEHALKYFNEHNSCYWCDQIKREVEYKSRVVLETAHFILFVPEACRWSYELVLIPKEHKPNFGYINEMEINDFADVLSKALKAYDNLLGEPDRNFWIHTMRYEPYHWHVGFIPHVKVLGGFELGAGIWVSDKASPEDAAKQLKDSCHCD